jgi:hypothetical protein
MEQEKQQAASRGQGMGASYVKFLGPNGEEKWSGVPINYSATKTFHICPPSGEGKPIRVEKRSHFFFTHKHPKGTGMVCPGSDKCLICQAVGQALNDPNPETQKRAKDVGRIRKQYFFNVVDMTMGPQAHIGQDGMMRPFIFAAGATIRDDINEILTDEQCGFKIMYPETARPVKVKRTKTGPQNTDVEWSARHQDPTPLPQEYWPIFENLWDLEAQIKEPTMEHMQEMVGLLGFGAAAYSAQPQAPAYNPYAQQAPAPAPAQAYAQAAPQPVAPAPIDVEYLENLRDSLGGQKMAPPPMAPPAMAAPQAAPTAYAPQAGVPTPPAPPAPTAVAGEQPDAELAALQAQLMGQ